MRFAFIIISFIFLFIIYLYFYVFRKIFEEMMKFAALRANRKKFFEKTFVEVKRNWERFNG